MLTPLDAGAAIDAGADSGGGGLDAGADAGGPDTGEPDAGADASVSAGPPVLLPVMGNVDPGTIASFTRVSFVLEDGEYTYFRVMGGDTFVSAVTSTMAVGRFVNESGTLDSFVLDLATNEARVLRLPDATGVWIVDANDAGLLVGSAERVRPGDTEPTTFAFRHDLETGRTTEVSIGDYSAYLALLEDGSALLHTQADGRMTQYIEDATGASRTELVRRGFEESFYYNSLAPDGRLLGLRSLDEGGGVISTLTSTGLTHQFFDIASPDGGLYVTLVSAIDDDGSVLARYEVPVDGSPFPDYRYAFLESLDDEPMAPPPIHPIFRDPALAQVTYDRMRAGRIWGVATYFGE